MCVIHLLQYCTNAARFAESVTVVVQIKSNFFVIQYHDSAPDGFSVVGFVIRQFILTVDARLRT